MLLSFLAVGDHKPWGFLGISFVILAVLLFAFSIYASRKWIKSNKAYSIVVLLFSLCFISMELIHEIGRFKQFGQYDWSSFPFQMCSVTMYVALMSVFFKDGRAKKAFSMFFATFTLLSGILPLIFAQGNLFRWPTLGGILFSFIWHILLLCLGGVSIGYNHIARSFRKEYKSLIAVAVMFLVITIIAQLLNVTIHYAAGGFEVADGVIKEAGYMPNYELDPDSASLFYISPYFKSNIPVVFDDIWLNSGWVMCWIVYVLAFVVGEYIVYFSTYGIKKIYFMIKNEGAIDDTEARA